MSQREFPSRTAVTSARLFSLLTLALVLVAALFPSSRATTQAQTAARPRRATVTSTPPQQPPPARRQTPATVPTPLPQATPAPVGTDAPPTLKTGDEGGQEVEDDEVVTVDTSLVSLNVRVIDRFNRPINDVRQEDFRVSENGVPQTVEFFTREEVPISYGLVVDNSGSMRFLLDKVIEAGKTIVNSNKPGDETFLVRFASRDDIEIAQEFTPKKEDVVDSLDNLYIQTGQTAIVDAVYLSAERVANYKKGNDVEDKRRRALILVTDGEDRDSFYKREQLFEHLRENDVQIYVIGFVNELDKEGGFIRKSKREQAMELINKLARETGGRAYFPQSLAELPNIAQEITRDLRTQYVIGYLPTNKARDGSYRTVKVSVVDEPGRDRRIAVTRSGYTAPRGNVAPTTTTPAKPRTPSASTVRKP